MSRSSTLTRLWPLLTFSIAAALAHAHSVVVPDRVVTLEIPEREVEQLARRIDAILVAHGFAKAPPTPRLTLDMHALPPSASAEEGNIVAKFEKKAAVSIFVQVTTCRAVFAMRLADGVARADGEKQLRLAEEALIKGLSGRKDMPLTITEGLGVRDNPCMTSAQSE
jgi:hypothetical protein